MNVRLPYTRIIKLTLTLSSCLQQTSIIVAKMALLFACANNSHHIKKTRATTNVVIIIEAHKGSNIYIYIHICIYM